MRALLLALAAFMALTIPASASDPQPMYLTTKAVVGPWPHPVGGDATTLYASAVGLPGQTQQALAGYFEAWSMNDGPQGPADATAIVGMACGANANGYAVGGYFEAHAVHAAGKGVGAEIRSGNFTGSPAIYQPNYASRLVGLWLTTAGQDSSAAIQVGNIAPSRWKVGLGFTAGSVAESSIRDDSNSQVAIDVRGAHETAIRVAQGAGKVVFDAPIWWNGKLIEAVPCGVAGYKCLAVRD